MIYNFLRILANIAIRVFYGKIEVSGLENIPRKGPLLIASNHPNGFLEPIIIACLAPRPMHFMVRGDVFRKKWLRPLLVNTNQIPIFRFKDGFSALRENNANLKEAYKALENDAAIILFIEGGTEPVKTLRPFQKGMARMASAYLADKPQGTKLPVLPVGINFVSPYALRSRVVLNIGEPIASETYFAESEAPKKGIRQLTNDVYDQLLPLAFDVKSKDRQDTLNQTLRLVEGLFDLPFYPIVSRKSRMWPTFKSVSDTINLMDDDQFDTFDREVRTIRQNDPYEVLRAGKSQVLAAIWTVLLFVPAMIGLVLNIVPGLVAQQIAKKVLKKDNVVFIASIVLSSAVGLYTVYYMVMIMMLSIFYGWGAFLFLLAWPLGFVYLWWKNNFRSAVRRSTYHLTSDEQTQVIDLMNKYKISLQNTTK